MAIGNGGVGAPLVEHVGVPAARLAPGRAFDAAQVTQLTAFLEALAERIGADPGGDRWKAEVVTVIKERWVQRGLIVSMDDDLKYERKLKANPWARSCEGFCEQSKETINGILERGGGSLSREEAQLLDVFARIRSRGGRRWSERPSRRRPRAVLPPPRGLHCMTAAGATAVAPGQPRYLAPEGFISVGMCWSVRSYAVVWRRCCSPSPAPARLPSAGPSWQTSRRRRCVACVAWRSVARGRGASKPEAAGI